MSASVPITNTMAAGYLAQMPLGGDGETPPVGTPATITGHNTHLHLGVFVLALGALIASVHYAGFRFSYDVGLGRG